MRKRKLFNVLMVLTVLMGLFGGFAVSAAPKVTVQKLVPLTLHLTSPDQVVVVENGDRRTTFRYTSNPAGQTHMVEEGPWVFNAGDTCRWDMLVFTAERTLVAKSWWPNQTYTPGRAYLGGQNHEFYIFEQKTPKPFVSGTGTAVIPASGMTLFVLDSHLFVQVAPWFVMYGSRPDGVNRLIPAGPYIFYGTNCSDKDIMVLNEDMQLVAQSWWPGELYTRARAEGVPTGAFYWVLGQAVPDHIALR